MKIKHFIFISFEFALLPRVQPLPPSPPFFCLKLITVRELISQVRRRGCKTYLSFPRRYLRLFKAERMHNNAPPPSPPALLLTDLVRTAETKLLG